MCTSLSFTRPALFGRNLDLEVSFGEQVAIAPRGFAFPFHHRPPMTSHFAMIGMASVAAGIPLYAEAVNEKGLYMAGLNFPGNAFYFPDAPSREHVAPYELIPLVLGSCATLAQARALLEGVRLAAVPFGPGYPLAPLHWHIADATGSLTAEPMADGLHLHENPVGVLTNNPPFPFHRMALNSFQGLSPRQPVNTFAPDLALQPYGQGMGAIGLPGDASPMSRFVRAAFLKAHAAFGGDSAENVMQFFHILDAVAMVRGTVVTPEEKYDETIYSCCVDAASLTYYYKTYANSRVCAVRLTGDACQGAGLRLFPLERQADIRFIPPTDHKETTK